MNEDRNRRAAIVSLLPLSLLLGLARLAPADQAFDSGTGPAAQTGGVPTVDTARVSPGDPGVPLRYGNVLSKSERVTLAGRLLVAGQDYAIDYAAGVVYLYRAAREGDAITVEYRYDKTKGSATSNGIAGLPALRLGLLPGSGLSMNLGMGVTERAADGTVLRSNLFGTNNDLKLGSAGLTGVYMVGRRQRMGVEGGMSFDNKMGGDAATETGDSKFLVQAFRLGVAGGTFSIDKQDVSKNFVGFNSLRGGSLDDARLAQLQSERGLVRDGMGLSGARVLGGALSYSQRSVADEKGGIDWQSYGFASGGLKFNASTRRIDTGFARFKDLAEADRDQLAKEGGLQRGDYAGEFRSKVGLLGFSNASVQESATGKSVRRREAKIDTARFGFDFGDQTVDSGFSRFDSLLADEKSRWGLEAGLHRQSMGMRANGLFGLDLKARRENVGSKDGAFRNESAGLKGKTWSLDHVQTSAEKGFNRISSFSPTELGTRANEIAAMYADRPFSSAQAVQGGDLEALKSSNGLSRSFDRMALSPSRGSNFEATDLRLSGQKDGARVQTYSLTGRSGSFAYRRLNVGTDFSEISSLMSLERARLGEIKGLTRTDARLDLKFSGRASLTADQTGADTKDGAVNRTRISYTDPRLQFRMNTRSVDKGFQGASQLVDDERDALAALAGFRQREILLNWQALKNAKLEYAEMGADNEAGRERDAQRLALDWSVDPSLRIAYAKQSSGESDPLKTIFRQSMEKMSFSKNFGGAAFEYLSDRRDFSGTDAKTPDSRLEAMAVEAKVDKKTTLRTERSRTDFSDGKSESVATHSVRTEISKRLGVSVSDTKIDRSGDDPDETKRDYGFWFDFGGGIRLSYGYVRNLLGEDLGSQTTTLAFGKGAGRSDAQNVGGVQDGNINGTNVAFGSGANTWDDQTGRVQSFNNLRVKTSKPFGFLWMKGCALTVNMDTASDKAVWIRENRQVNFDGRMLGTSLGYEYRGQADPKGDRAIDRTLRLKTDPNDKAPISAAVMYKERTLPTDDMVAIRDFSYTLRPTKSIAITNQVQTNPETFRGDVILGSTLRADRANKWRVDFRGKGTVFGGSWEELVSEANKTSSRTAGVNMTLFGGSGSPVSIFYGLEQRDAGDVRATTDRYSVSFDQRPGPNQVFSLFVGNLSYLETAPKDAPTNNWSVRVNYQLRF